MINKRLGTKTLISLVCVASLAACVSAPQGSRVAVMPTPGKSLEVFAAEDQYCRNYAQQSIGSDTRADAAVGSAVVGTLLGAAVGSALSGRHHNNTAAGAATGLLMGTMVGAGNSAAEGQSAQHRYDIAYQQCMVAKQNQPAQQTYRRQGQTVVVPAPAPPMPQSAPYPSGYYPPPPGVQPPPPQFPPLR